MTEAKPCEHSWKSVNGAPFRCKHCGIEITPGVERPNYPKCAECGEEEWLSIHNVGKFGFPYTHKFQAAPNASEAPKAEDRCPRCWHRPHGTVCFNVESDGDCGCEYGKPAPAPEPKQGSEEPIEPVTELEAERSTSKILRTQLARAVAERDEARATKDMHKERQEEAWAKVAALRAEVETWKQLHSAHCSNPTCEGPRS